MTETATIETTGALEAERRRLSLDVRNGVPGADKELRSVERRIAELAHQRELAALADEEAQRREEQQREQAAAAELQEKRDQLQRLVAKADTLERDVFAVVDALAPKVAELVTLRRQQHALAWTLGVGRRWRGTARIADYIRSALPSLDSAFSGPHVRDRIGRPEADGPEVPAQHDEVVELMPEPPGPPLTLPSEGLRSTRPQSGSTSEKGGA